MERLPIEMLDKIVTQVVRYSPKDPSDPFCLDHKDVTDTSRRHLRLTCRTLKDIADKYIYQDIQFGQRKENYPCDVYFDNGSEEKLRALVTSSTKRPSVLSGLEVLAVYAHPHGQPRPKDEPPFPSSEDYLRETSAQLAFVLSYTSRLKMFAATADYCLLGLRILTHPDRGQESLTHLDIEVDRDVYSPIFVHTLNALHNLRWLRMGNLGSFSEDIAPDDVGPNDLPALHLPKLERLEILAEQGALDLEAPTSFNLARTAVLPSLISLRMHAPSAYPEGGTLEVERLGQTLRHLEVELRDDILMYSIHKDTPSLESLTFIYDMDDADDSEWVLQHPTLRRLVVSACHAWRSSLASIDPELCPKLESIQFSDFHWMEDSRGSFNTVAIPLALDLGQKGIMVLDASGKPFGGLPVAQRNGARGLLSAEGV